MKSYKTFYIGLALAVVQAILPIFNAIDGAFGKKDVIALIGAALTAGLGYAAKDFDVTGTDKK